MTRPTFLIFFNHHHPSGAVILRNFQFHQHCPLQRVRTCKSKIHAEMSLDDNNAALCSSALAEALRMNSSLVSMFPDGGPLGGMRLGPRVP